MENKRTHLRLIQGVINRMAGNSFHLKGWSVVLVSALFALAAKDSSVFFVYLAFFPAMAFWILDGFFLRQEKLFRKLFDYVRLKDESEIDFSMDTSVVSHDMENWPRVTVSRTLSIFHGTVVGSIIIVIAIINCRA